MVWHLIFLGYALGIAVGLLVDMPFVAGACFVLGASVLVAWFRIRMAQGVALALVLVGLGYYSAHTVREDWNVPPGEYTVSGRAVVIRPPEVKERSQEVSLQFTECPDSACPKHFVLGYFPVYDTLQYGDIITVQCPLKVPKNVGLDFDYRMYLAMKDIGFTCYPKQWKKEDDHGGNSAVSVVLRVRSALEKKLDAFVSYPESGLGKGLLFGGNGYLTKETQNNFSRTGMSHIVAVSGANVVIVAECFFLLAIACGLWRKQALWVSCAGIVCFVIMVGSGASALRAGLMGGLVLMASYSGRVSDGLRLWSLAVALMLSFNPLLLQYDLGFQLSFMATLGILLCMPLVESLASKKTAYMPSTLQEIFFMTLAAELFVLPIIMFNFQAFPALSLIANILVLPAIPVAMLFGFLASIFGFVFAPLAKLFGLIDYLILHYMMSVIQWLANRQFSSISIQTFGLWFVFIWYGLLFSGIAYLKIKEKTPDCHSRENGNPGSTDSRLA
jgi:competence protein ComEC